MNGNLGFRVARRLLRIVAWIVPAPVRRDWTREWEAELWHHAARLDLSGGGTWRTTLHVVARAFGALPDAGWIRRQFTLDADAVHDAVHAARMLIGARGFTVVALTVFAVGSGAATAIVSVADALLRRPIPVASSDRVMTVWQQNRETGIGHQDVAPGNALEWIRRARSFESAAIAEPWTLNTILPGRDPEYIPAARVGDRFFAVLGTTMFAGRAFLPREYQPGGGRVAILSHGMWRDRFGGDPSVVGRAVRLDNDDAYTIVGVLPPRLELRLFDTRARRPEPLVWLPKQGLDAVEPTLRGMGYWNVLARLRPGVPVAEAEAELEAISQQLAREYPVTNRHIAAQVVPLRSHLVGSLRLVLPLLLAASAALLLVACLNVASLLLARGAARMPELAVRQALGASRWRLVRQMLVETLLLAGLGGVLGLAVARVMLDGIAALRPLDVAGLDHVPLDGRMAAIACGVTMLAALLAGLMPALDLSRSGPGSTLKQWRSTSRRGARGALVVAEVAGAVVLLVGAGLLVRSFISVQRVHPGFSRENVALLQVFASTRLNTPEKRVAFFDQALEGVRTVPGVTAAGGVTSMPFGEAKVIVRAALGIAGRPPATGDQALAYVSAVAGDYFQAMEVPLVKGRFFDPSDRTASRHVVLISQSAARQFWRDSDPLGSRVQFRFTGQAYDAEVIGIVGDVLHEALDRQPPPEVYLPYAQSGFRALTLVARTAPGNAADLQAMKERIWALDPLQSVYVATTLEPQVSKTLADRRFSLLLFGGFAAAALLLAAAGVYGVVSFTTSRRTREFGVRLALGASHTDIIRVVMAEGLLWACLGVLAGAVLAVPVMRLLETLLFQVTPADPLTFVLVGLAMVMVALAACYVPARRAMRVAPAEALRLD